jgi:hypothetical protein
MSKKLILVFVGVIFFSGRLVFANVIINEIMYNPTQDDAYNEWIELYNTDSSQSQDLSNLTLCGTAIKSGYVEKNSSSVSNDGGMLLGAGQYAIITDGGSGTQVYDNFSIPSNALALHVDSSSICSGLSNSGTTVTLGGSSTNSISYTYNEGANGDGNSLQLVNGSWVAATPTPGAQNIASSTVTTSSNTNTSSVVVGGGLPANDSNNNDISSVTSTTNNQTEVQNIKTEIAGKTLGFVGLPISLNATTFGTSGEKIYFGKYFWNFDDGDSKEISLTDSQPFTHTFYYPGDYVVSLDYYQNYYGSNLVPDATSQINIKIIPTDISISNVGDDKDFFVELTNNTDYNADISGWVLSSAQKSFSFPKNTIIISKQKMMISPKVTNFSINDKNTLKLMDSGGNTIFNYTNPIVLVALATHKKTATTLVAEDIPDVNNLIATALPNNIQDPNDSNDSTTFSSLKEIMIFITAFIFVGLSAYLVYFVRQKKVLPKSTADDFEILDE